MKPYMKHRFLITCWLVLTGIQTAAANDPTGTVRSTDSTTSPPLKPFVAEYYLTKKRTTIGEITLTLKQTGDMWRLTSDGKATGLAAIFVHDTIQEVTKFRFINRCMQPLHYTNTKSKDEDGEYPETVFDWDLISAHVTGEGIDIHVPLKPKMLNEHLVTLAIMRDAPKPDTQFSYNVLKGTGEETQSFKKGDTEKIRVDGKEFNAVKITREHGSRTTVSWHSVDQQYLPVKIERYKDGKLKSQMTFKSYKLLENAE